MIVVRGGNPVTVSGPLTTCPAARVPELRRPNTTGRREFVGDIKNVQPLSGGKYAISYDTGGYALTPPIVGETLIVYCAGTGAGRTESSSGTRATAALSGLPDIPWSLILLAGLGIVALMMFKE